MNGFKVRLAAAGLLGFAFATGVSAQDIDTRSDGSSSGKLFGEFAEGTPDHSGVGFGQTFVAGGSHLDSFSFWLGSAEYDFGGLNQGNARFRAYLMEWDGTGPGAFVWQSAIRAGSDAPAAVEYSFDVGLALDPGAVYIAFLSPQPGPGTGDISGRTGLYMQHVVRGSYSGGNLIHLRTSNVGSADWTQYSWRSHGADAAFTADFSSAPTNVVPEPITMVLMGSGLVGVAGAARRRREAELETDG